MSAVGLSLKQRTARKTHTCYWCASPIEVGQVYVESRQVEDGRIDTFRSHTDCVEAEQRASAYIDPLEGEPACCNVDIDGGYHVRGRNCSECSDLPLVDAEDK